MKIGDYLYCLKNLGSDFIKGKKYEITRFIFGGVTLLNEENYNHEVTNGFDGWLKYFKTKEQIRKEKLERITK